MRLGLFGATFDPVHVGHLLLAEQCREQCGLDQVWFVPSGSPPHKRGATITPGRMRAEMLDFATAGVPRFIVSGMELQREGPTFTVDQLIAKVEAL
jgi:nicotinate-nucleotide adenylyltransferase